MIGQPSSNFMVEAIFDRLPMSARSAASGFTNFNCPVCQETRRRCGICPNSEGLGINCFNCGFKAGWSQGSTLSSFMRTFLTALGMTELEVVALNFRAFQLRFALLRTPGLRAQVPHFAAPSFKTLSLPHGAKSFTELDEAGCIEADYVAVKRYVAGRGDAIANSHEFWWSPDENAKMNRRVIIPIIYQGRTVGFSARAIDANISPRYHSSTQPNLLFNARALTAPERKVVVLVEGVFDAIAIDSVGMMGAHLNAAQIAWIKSYRKMVVVVPDRDEAGLKMIDIAQRQSWHVAFPWDFGWHADVKDVAQATQLYGRLWTLTCILDTATDSPARIAAQRLRLQA